MSLTPLEENQKKKKQPKNTWALLFAERETFRCLFIVGSFNCDMIIDDHVTATDQDTKS